MELCPSGIVLFTPTIIDISTSLALIVMAGVFRARLQRVDDRLCVWNEQLGFSIPDFRESPFFIFRFSCFMVIGSCLPCSPSFGFNYFCKIIIIRFPTGGDYNTYRLRYLTFLVI